jgi:hypothetical protein
MAQFRTDKWKLDNSHLITRYEVMGLMETITPSMTMLDAYGSFRVSPAVNVFTSQRIGSPQEKFNHITIGTANATYHVNSSSYILSVGTANGDSIIRESTNVIPFQPGKSTRVLISFRFSTPKANLIQRVGFFDEKNGIYLENDGNNTYIVARSSASGTLVEERVARPDWNFDKMDGSGYSSQFSHGTFTLDPLKANILWIDMASFSVSNIRVGFMAHGKMMPAHVFHGAHQDHEAHDILFTSLCLPIRYELKNVGPTTSNSFIQQVNAAGISEGGFELKGINDGASRGYTIATADTLATAGVEYPLIAYRLKADRRNNVVIPNNFHIYVDSNATVSYRVWINAVSSGGVWQTKGPNRHIEYNTGITGIANTNGKVVQGGFVTSQEAVRAGAGDVSNLNYILGRFLDGTTQEVILTIIPTTNNTKVLTKCDWIELV